MTLDADVEAKLARVMREKGLSFKEALNSAVRAGLGGATITRRDFKMRTKAMGFDPTIDFDRALTLAGAAEDDEFVRKLPLGK